MLINRSVDVPPPARDLHIGLIDIPAVADRVPARPGRVGEERREALHPPGRGDVIDLDSRLDQELLDVAVREAVPEVPAQCQDDDLRRKPETPKRRTLHDGHRTTKRSEHPTTVALGHSIAQCNRARHNRCPITSGPRRCRTYHLPPGRGRRGRRPLPTTDVARAKRDPADRTAWRV